jgi:Flp pilus assembly protein TadD
MRRWLAPAAVVLLAIVVNLNVLQNGFVYDDGAQIEHNSWLPTASYRSMFTRNVWGFLGPRGGSNYYRPLMHLVNLGCYRLFGLQPWGYHLVSLLFHAGCTLLVFAIARKIGFSETFAFWGALLFGIHPIHPEAVAWVAANTELVYAFLVLLAFLLHLYGRRFWPPILLLVGLLMKETAMILVPLIAAWEWDRTREMPGPSRTKSLALVLAPFLIPLAIYFPLRIYALHGMVMITNPWVISLDQQFYTTFALLGRYLWKLLDPLPYNIFYVFHETTSPTDPSFLRGLAATLAVIGLGWILWRRNSRLWLAVFLILVPLTPVLWIQRLGQNVFTERYLYLPAAGFCWLVAALLERTPRWIAYAPVAGLLGGLLASWYAVTSFTRNYEWHDNIILYEKALLVSPESTLIRGNLANAYFLGGDAERALPEYRRVVHDKPLNAIYQDNLGSVLARTGHLAEARQAYERARALGPELAEPWANLGLLSEMEGRQQEAEEEYRSALKLDPMNVDAHQSLGALLASEGKFDEAELHFRVAASHSSLGKLLVSIGRLTEAEKTLRKAIDADVTNAEALYLLGSVLRGEGREREAQMAFHQMRRMFPYTKWRPPSENPSGGGHLEGGQSDDKSAHSK